MKLLDRVTKKAGNTAYLPELVIAIIFFAEAVVVSEDSVLSIGYQILALGFLLFRELSIKLDALKDTHDSI